jgi:hypothetical protein
VVLLRAPLGEIDWGERREVWRKRVCASGVGSKERIRASPIKLDVIMFFIGPYQYFGL